MLAKVIEAMQTFFLFKQGGICNLQYRSQKRAGIIGSVKL